MLPTSFVHGPFHKKIKHFFICSWTRLLCLYNSLRGRLLIFFHYLLFRVNLFWIEFFYFVLFSWLGFLALKASNPRKPSFVPDDFDLFFTSASSVTVSSISTVEMEVFSQPQLVILTILMFLGGAVFTSLLELQLLRSKLKKKRRTDNEIDSFNSDSSKQTDSIDKAELGMANHPQFTDDQKSDFKLQMAAKVSESEALKLNSVNLLTYLVSFYLVLVHIAGIIGVSMYLRFVPSAREKLKNRGFNLATFVSFTIVSSFANCGFLPVNENMMIFKKNSGLLLILIPQLLMGNVLYPSCLRSAIWFLEKITKRIEFRHMLKNSMEMEYDHLLSGVYTMFLGITVFGFTVAQFVLSCFLEWHSEVTDGLSAYQKLVGFLFEVVNSRHSGESIFDLSEISPAILVTFIAMMYLPPYTSFLPIQEKEKISTIEGKRRRQKKRFVEYILFSQLSYLTFSIILICIIEKEKLRTDPLNFNMLSIAFEVISAYGNVGFSIGYSCRRRINPDGYCKDTWYGFAGRLSKEGKIILILVMFFGRLKKFNMKGGQAWVLS